LSQWSLYVVVAAFFVSDPAAPAAKAPTAPAMAATKKAPTAMAPANKATKAAATKKPAPTTKAVPKKAIKTHVMKATKKVVPMKKTMKKIGSVQQLSDQIWAKKVLAGYCQSIRTTILAEWSQMGMPKFCKDGDKEKVQNALKEAENWLRKNASCLKSMAKLDEFEATLDKFKGVVTPIMMNYLDGLENCLAMQGPMMSASPSKEGEGVHRDCHANPQSGSQPERAHSQALSGHVVFARLVGS
jgi:hypothetical protein